MCSSVSSTSASCSPSGFPVFGHHLPIVRSSPTSAQRPSTQWPSATAPPAQWRSAPSTAQQHATQSRGRRGNCGTRGAARWANERCTPWPQGRWVDATRRTVGAPLSANTCVFLLGSSCKTGSTWLACGCLSARLRSPE